MIDRLIGGGWAHRDGSLGGTGWEGGWWAGCARKSTWEHGVCVCVID